MIGNFWNGLGRMARAGLIAGIVCIVGATAAMGYWLLRPDYQVLFTDLSQQDASAIGAELERLKVPYMVSEQGASGETILVDKGDVYKTRIKLMGKDIPLHGVVGLELFNNSDFGMTEFAQKINYQRAMQGELTRTILSLSEIRDARVMLALPEQGLFKQSTVKAKASITLNFRPGQSLRPEQVAGIQRLIASSVPGVAARDVTIVDQSGMPLTRAVADSDSEPVSNLDAIHLELKKETENYLSRKAGEVLAQALGAGQALASVDVALNMDRVQTTLEDVVPAPGRAGSPAAGVVIRQRETLREVGAPLNVRMNSDQNSGASGGTSQRETEYVAGRRVEHIISQPGSIQRIQVVAVIRKNLDAAQQEQVRRMVAASVGASAERGDTVVVQAMDAIGAPMPKPENARETILAEPVEKAIPGVQSRVPGIATSVSSASPLAVNFVLLLAVVAVAFLWMTVRRKRFRSQRPDATRLSDEQREAALSCIQAWMHGDSTRNATGEGR